jgi:hypothetical protein
MNKPKKFIVSRVDAIPCTAFHPLRYVIAKNLKEAKIKIKSLTMI